MEEPSRTSLHVDYARAKDELTQHIEEKQIERQIASSDRSPQLPEPHRPNYALLREEHARALDALDRNADETARAATEGRTVSSELPEPTRPTEVRSPFPDWSDNPSRPHQEASAMRWVKASYERRQAAERERQQSIDENREQPSPDVAPDQSPKRDDSVQR